MDLYDYKRATALSWAQISARTARIGRRLLPTHLQAIAAGKRNFGVDIGLAVEEATERAVTVSDLAAARRAHLAQSPEAEDAT